MHRFLRPRATRLQLIPVLCAIVAGCASSGESLGHGAAPGDRDVPLLDRLAPEDGTIISVLEATIRRPWDALGSDAKLRHDEEAWESTRESLSNRADQLTYSSDGLRIGAFLVRPATTEGRRLPAVIVNRDGIANRGLDQDEILAELARYSDAGFVAATTAYRGNRLSQGTDELGGDDVNDVLSLVALLQRLDYVDGRRVFMVGEGRGGLMTYRALEMGAPIRAAAVIAAPSDFEELESLNPEVSSGFEAEGGWPGLAEIHGSWTGTDRRNEIERRSPGLRAEGLTTPLMVVHGRQDELVPVGQALGMTTSLREAGTPFETLIYGYGDHALVAERRDWQARVLEWFERHDTRAMIN